MGKSKIPNHLVFIEQALLKREQSNLLRQIPEVLLKKTPYIKLVDGSSLVDFASNDYLGLSDFMGKEGLNLDSNISVSSTASRLLGGDSIELQEAEKCIAELFGAQNFCTIFPSTWQANASVIPSLVGRNDLIITDKYAHNSIINAAKLSGAKLLRYKHQDLRDLERLLEENRANHNRCLIATETVFSMQGSVLDYKAFLSLCNEYQAISYLDEAHAFGVYGNSGIGLVPKDYLVDIRVGALGKAAASSGGFVITSAVIRDYLANFADGLIYSTAISPIHATIITKQIVRLRNAEKQRAELMNLVAFTKSLLKDQGYSVSETGSHIIPIVLGDDEITLKIKALLLKKGYWVAAIRPPTVPKGQSCIRISITAKHSEKHIRQFVNALKDLNPNV